MRTTAKKRKLSKRAPKHIRLGHWMHRRKGRVRVGSLILAGVFGFGIFIPVFNVFIESGSYTLSGRAEALVGRRNDFLSDSLKLDGKTGTFEYNEGYTPASEVASQGVRPRFSASFNLSPEKGTTVTDPVTKTSITFKPKFGLEQPKKDQNRLIYPLKTKNAVKVVSLKTIGFKEDIIINKYQGDALDFVYELELPAGTEARMESNGALSIYGADYSLLGDVAVGSDSDKDLLEKARQNAVKRNLLFTFPAPFIKESNKKVSDKKAWFTLDGKTLTIHAGGLKDASYPLTIDPSVYIETAAKLMRGNNETNTDFDVDNELIQKSQTTGARIDAWQDNLDMSSGTWDHSSAAAGGYIYRVGGATGPTRPQVVSQTETLQNSNSTSFAMDMPATRPAGDLYLAVMCYDGSAGDGSGGSVSGNTISTPTGWTKYANRNGHAAYYKVGTDQGGGSEASSVTFTGDSEKWGGVIIRVTGFDSTTPISGTPGVGHSNSNAIPVFPATTPNNDATLVIRAVGADDDEPSDTSWVPAGHTKIASGGPTGTQDCAYAAASLDTPPLSGVSTGTATLADNTINDDYGASSIAINPAATSTTTLATVNWAKFNSSTYAIESPNPGNGACSGWCSSSAYDLPEARRGFSLVAYNGYLYVIGGVNGSGTRQSTIYIAKIGANGEPSLWHPSGGTAAYWYSANLNSSTARSYLSAVAYNNRMYIVGGATNASTTGTTTMEYADINPMGTLGSWTSGTSLPSARYKHTAHIYNDVLYLIGGDSSGTLQNTVYYNRLNSDGSMNSWVQTTSFTTARSTMGGSYTTIWGAYIYLSGGCTAINGSGYCTTVASDTQLASINADGSIAEWGTITNLQNQRIGYNILGWQDGLYRLGGCVQQNTSTGNCASTLADVDYGVINESGEASTVGTSFASGAAPCSGSTPYNCDLPSSSVGNVLNSSVVVNGYLYIMGGCTSDSCNSYSSGIVYQSVGSDGSLQKPASCAGSYTDSYCVSSTSLPATRGASAPTVFNDRIYLVGGFPSRNDISYVTVNNDGSLGSWTSPSFASVGVSENLAYTFAYSRANPSSAGSVPGNLYIFGGCDGNNGVGCSNYSSSVYKCNISTAGAPSSCTTTGQLQIGNIGGDTSPGLGAHAGAVYAGYIYLMGGLSPNITDHTTIYYAKFDESNNVVAVSGSAWQLASHQILVGRRRGAGFGYNGYLYVTGGYDGSDALADIEFGKIDVSTGDVATFSASTVSISRRWGLSVPVSNSFAYVIGGCTEGSAPTGCTTRTDTIQTFQIYNNDSGAVKSVTSMSDDTFAASTDRWGASSVVLNGYLYVAGGCTSATDCTTAVSDVQYAPISVSDGSIGTWASASNGLPAVRTWGKLVTAGGSLYYLGGQSSTATDERAEVYYVSTFSSGNITASWSTASGGIGDTNSQAAQERTKFGAAVWNNRIYVVGGLNASAAVTNTVYISPQLSSGGNIAADSWTSDSDVPDVARFGAAVTAYANNLYILGGNDGTNYLGDVQFTQINTDGTVDDWTFTTSLPGSASQGEAFVANGYMYLVGGRSAATSCAPNTLIAPISANTTIATGNNPTGIGEWFETNARYSGGRYGAAVAYERGKVYVMGGGCTSPQAGTYNTGTITQSGTTVTGSGTTNWTDNYIGGTITYQDASTATIVSVNGVHSLTVSATKTIGSAQTYSISVPRHSYGVLKSQPQVAKYSRMIDTDTDVFPNSWLMNGIDNSIGARWQVRYRSMHDLDTLVNPNEDCGTSATMATMTTWGQETNFGNVTLGNVESYTPKNSSGGNINCARYYYFFVSIDASQTFGYPEDVTRGPTISDITLFFTSDPSKRLRHGKTFTGGELQPLNTPCRRGSAVSGDPNYNCPLP